MQNKKEEPEKMSDASRTMLVMRERERVSANSKGSDTYGIFFTL
jgi:hypothetical protein